MLSIFNMLLDAIKDAIAFPDSRFPIPDSRFPIPDSLLPKIPTNHCDKTTQNPQQL
ncbi:hypothetical protein BJP36_42115 [Moorena producens JHB]|uniref:Uncharacterized protein n=1 Tax=Moorena producens (strain JHB) TaxID=1454205 RepID=A0A9Q9SSS4_MOOP1|nr:hypothetical protein [Moorena producens]WAN68957.1 hypothetical protein BJP36_42115 [Moorena producens JHB]